MELRRVHLRTSRIGRSEVAAVCVRQFDPCGLYLPADRGRRRGCASGSCPQPDAPTMSPACRLLADKFLSLAGPPLRFGRRCGRPAVACPIAVKAAMGARSEEHTSELPSLIRISYAAFCLNQTPTHH